MQLRTTSSLQSVLVHNYLVITATSPKSPSDVAMLDLFTSTPSLLKVCTLRQTVKMLYLLTILNPDFRYRVIEVSVRVYTLRNS
jgi:hypothetical protein